MPLNPLPPPPLLLEILYHVIPSHFSIEDYIYSFSTEELKIYIIHKPSNSESLENFLATLSDHPALFSFQSYYFQNLPNEIFVQQISYEFETVNSNPVQISFKLTVTLLSG